MRVDLGPRFGRKNGVVLYIKSLRWFIVLKLVDPRQTPIRHEFRCALEQIKTITKITQYEIYVKK